MKGTEDRRVGDERLTQLLHHNSCQVGLEKLRKKCTNYLEIHLILLQEVVHKNTIELIISFICMHAFGIFN